MKRLTYAGIGSRKTPRELASRMHSIATVLERRGWMLHSGGADRADTWFEQGVKDSANARIFLPWPGFNGHKSTLHEVSERAHEIAREFHPKYHRLTAKGRLLMARNSYQVLGPDLASPVTCVVCWTPGGEVKGGTGQALRIAAAYDVPVFNLWSATAVMRLETFVREVEDARRVPFPDDAEFERASGDVVCKMCGLSYYKHPNAPNFPTMHRICDGAWTRDEQPDVVWVKT